MTVDAAVCAKCRPSHWSGYSDDQSYHMAMRQIAAAKFKEQCLSILDEIDEDGIVITKRGKPVAKLIPIRAQSASLIGSLRGKVIINGDVLSTGVAWDAES